MRPKGWGLDPIGFMSLWAETPESLLSLSMWTHQEKDMWKQRRGGHLQARKRVLTRNCPCWHLISDVWPPESWENKFLLFKPFSLWYFVITQGMWGRLLVCLPLGLADSLICAEESQSEKSQVPLKSGKGPLWTPGMVPLPTALREKWRNFEFLLYLV